MSEDIKLYKLNIYFAHTGPLKLHNVTEKALARWNKDFLAGSPFLSQVGNFPYFFNPEYIIHTEVYEQLIGQYSDDPRLKADVK